MQGVRSCSCESKVHATANLCRDLRSSHGVDSHLHRLASSWKSSMSSRVYRHSPYVCTWCSEGVLGLHKAQILPGVTPIFLKLGETFIKHMFVTCDMIPIKQIARIFDLGVTSSALMHFVRYYSTFLPTPSTLRLAQHLHLLSCSNILLLSTTSMLYD